MKSCKCIIQSGKKAGKVCGKPTKEKLHTCGIHAKTCHDSLLKKPKIVEKSPEPVRLKREIILSINAMIINSFPEKVTFGRMKKLLEQMYGPIDFEIYKDHVRDMRERVAKVNETCDLLRRDAGRILPRYDLIA